MSPPLPPPYSSMSDASHPPAPPSPPHPVNLDPHVLIQHLENLNARTQRLEQENKQIHEQQQQAQRQLNPLLDLPLPGMHATSHPARAIAGHSPHLKLRPPPPYTHLTGKMPLDVWLFQVERYLGVLAVDDDRTKIEYTSSLLHEDALAWLQSYARDHPDYTHTMSWEDFTKELRRQFMPLMAEAVARQELMKLVQGAKRIQQYITTFRHISQRSVTMDTVTRKQLFINGLHPSIQWSIQKDDKPENTLEEVMAQATKLDVMRQQFRRQIAGGVGYGRGTFLNRNVPSRGYNNHRPVQYSDFR